MQVVPYIPSFSALFWASLAKHLPTSVMTFSNLPLLLESPYLLIPHSPGYPGWKVCTLGCGFSVPSLHSLPFCLHFYCHHTPLRLHTSDLKHICWSCNKHLNLLNSSPCFIPVPIYSRLVFPITSCIEKRMQVREGHFLWNEERCENKGKIASLTIYLPVQRRCVCVCVAFQSLLSKVQILTLVRYSMPFIFFL